MLNYTEDPMDPARKSFFDKFDEFKIMKPSQVESKNKSFTFSNGFSHVMKSEPRRLNKRMEDQDNFWSGSPLIKQQQPNLRD